MRFDIFAKLQEEINDFDSGGYYLAGEPKTDSSGIDRNLKGEKGGYYYSQKETLESIDLASASKYKKGIKDQEGQRKTFINIVNFYRDVMKMKIIIKVSNYLFEPLSLDFTWPVFLMARKFNVWSEEESYDDQIQDYAHDLSTYGTTVSKKLADCMDRVPLRMLRNTQSARSLYHAASTGGYVIIEDDKHYNEIKEYPAWYTEGLSPSKSYNVFERYALVPKSLYDNEAWTTNGGVIETVDENEEWILVQAILIPDAQDQKKRETITSGKIVFMEKVDEESWPLEECHTERIDGRWLGRGEIEKQLENQIARNLTANLRRRGLLWATKKIYQSSDEDVQSQLLMEVRDGQVLYVKPNGTITQVNTQNQHLGEFTSDDREWKENSQQISFAFNIATGENMPSNTPFSLGVVLDRAVSSHFSAVRNRFSNFLKRNFFNQILDIFRDEYSEAHTQQIAMGALDIENLKESVVTFHVNERVFDKITRRQRVNIDEIRQEVIEEMERNPYLFIEIPEDFYPDAHYYMKLNINDDIGPDVQTLTSLYQALSAKGDPRAEQVLKMIFAKQGKSLAYIAGKKPEPVPALPTPTAEAPGPRSPIQPERVEAPGMTA